MTRLYITRRD